MPQGFSGFYLALIIVLWLLMGRGLWPLNSARTGPSAVATILGCRFSPPLLLLAIVFGAALGNLIRGVPLNAEGYFFVALWTDFIPGPEPGILDWFTLLLGLASAVILTLHGPIIWP